MDLGLQIKELVRLVNVTSDIIINWELRNVKPERQKKGSNLYY